MAEGGDITVTLGLAAIIAAVVSYFTARIAGYSKDVIEERSKWREKIRYCARSSVFIRLPNDQVPQHGLMTSGEIEAELITRLNPEDREDIKIIKCFRRLAEDKVKTLEREFLIRIALLLKHDWERAKWEARVFRNPLGPPQRMKFEHYKDRRAKLESLL